MTNSIPSLLNQTPLYIERTEVEGGDAIIFYLATGAKVTMYHSQDCCESVYIEDINSNLDSLLFKPILQADEKVSTAEDDLTPADSEDYYSSDESYTWTFYTLANATSVVDIRWYGSSNGYYSESVDLDVGTYDLHSLPNYDYIKATYPELLI